MSCGLAPRGKESFQQGLRLACRDAVEHLGDMMALRMRKNPSALRYPAGLRIARPVVEPCNARRGDSARTHGTRLQRHIKHMTRQPLRSKLGAGRAQRQYFRVRRRILILTRPVAGCGDNLAFGINNDGPHGNLAAFSRRTRFAKRRLHVGIELHGLNWPQKPPFRKANKRDMRHTMSKPTTPPGDRIAKVLSRAGIASRREAERMIEAGRVSVNGAKIDSPALNVTARDQITVDGKPITAPEPPRMWLYHKPTGLVSTDADEKGRETIYDKLPEDMPRVMSIGRLDLNSEGLLLLTNDGGLKRRLELPSTGWLRRYRVRVNGRPTDETLAPLREGITADGERFQPMIVTLDRQQGANAWLTIGLREGRNREIRRALAEVGLTVNRLIRISYGPFQLGDLKPGEVDEVRRKILRDQLGLEAEETTYDGPGKRGPGGLQARKPTGVKRFSARRGAPKGKNTPRGKPGRT